MNDTITNYLKAIESNSLGAVQGAFEEVKALTGILPDTAFLSEPASSPIWLFRSTTVFEFKSMASRGFRVYNITKRISDLEIVRDDVGEGLLRVTAHVNFAEPLSLTFKGSGTNMKYLSELIYSLFIPNLI
jgi:hypothetical protein